jgi:xanthine dehydrogenase accessory factor
MRELLPVLQAWSDAGRRAVLARVVDLAGSGPRLPGAAMAIADDGEVLGSVTGGCVESSVVLEAEDVLATGRPRVVQFGFSDDDAFAVGLTCGGTVRLYLEMLDASVVDILRRNVDEGSPIALLTVIDGEFIGAKATVDLAGHSTGTLGESEVDRVALRDTAGALASSSSTSIRSYGPCDTPAGFTHSVFVETFAPPPRMVIFGAMDFTGALVSTAKLLGYHVTVCDARPTFTTATRFPEADEIVVDWPHRFVAKLEPPLGPRDAVAVLTHDHKFDVPAIAELLSGSVGYIGAMGSRRTNDERLTLLREAGVQDEALVRLHAPIGLDIGNRTPAETAIAICAEIVASRSGRSGVALRTTAGPIH